MYKCNKCNTAKPAESMVTLKHGRVTPFCKECKNHGKRERRKSKREGTFVSLLSLPERQRAFLQNAVAVHGTTYRYDRTEYQSAHSHVEIFCTKHGGYFFQSPTSHLSGNGCDVCGIKDVARSRLSNTHEFTARASAVHSGRYTYLNTEYTGCKGKVAVTCAEHGDFSILADSHLQGRGCKKCAKNGYNTSKPGKLYVLQLNDIVKVGITNFGVKARAAHISRGMPEKFKVVKSWEWDDGLIANAIETRLLRHLRLHFESPVERFHGWTECFIGVDVEELLERIDSETMETQ